ncbi:helix-turn-helix transcriptional regulator [Sphingobacterium detergens]
MERNNFNNLIALAKNNNAEFLALFSEIYPDFVASLKKINPKIRSSELEFCAMTFLNFSTKNIAQYTFVTVRAVQVRKNRLRKKLNIPSDIDFNNWMRGQIQRSPLAEQEESLVEASQN